MKFFYSFLCVIILIGNLNAQDIQEHSSFNEIGYEYGIFSSLNPESKPGLNGEIMKLKYAHFFGQIWGVQSGLNLINNLEGSNIIYTIPLYLTYRSPIDNSIEIRDDAETIGGFLFGLILAILPTQSEFFFGMNTGYIKPGNGVYFTDPSGEVYSYYDSEQRFFSTVDLGMSLKYRIGRVGISLNPAVSYLISSNFKYYSNNSDVDGYSPRVFMNGTVGLSYNF